MKRTPYSSVNDLKKISVVTLSELNGFSSVKKNVICGQRSLHWTIGLTSGSILYFRGNCLTLISWTKLQILELKCSEDLQLFCGAEESHSLQSAPLQISQSHFNQGPSHWNAQNHILLQFIQEVSNRRQPITCIHPISATHHLHSNSVG